jgi:hypothetical protein
MSTQTPIIPHTQHPDHLPSEVMAFCGLLARIMHRCLQEQDLRMLSLIYTLAMCVVPAKCGKTTTASMHKNEQSPKPIDCSLTR